jgi:hypothetical protein
MSEQLNKDDHKVISEFLGLLVNLGKTPIEAFEATDAVLKTTGWSFVYFNDIEDFWIIDNETK